jgi:hypothetical protein
MELHEHIRQKRMEPPSAERDDYLAALELLLACPDEADRIFTDRIAALSPAEHREFIRRAKEALRP